MPWHTRRPVHYKHKRDKRASDGPRQDPIGAVVAASEVAVAAVNHAVVVVLQIVIRFRSIPFRCSTE